MKLAEVAQKLGCRLEGPPELEIRGVAGIDLAEPGQLTFLANRRYFRLLRTTRASAVLVEEGVALEREASLPALAHCVRQAHTLPSRGPSSFSISRRGMRQGFIRQRSSRRAPRLARARILGRTATWMKRRKSAECCAS